MTRKKKVAYLQKAGYNIISRYRECDNRIIVEAINGVQYKSTTDSQVEAGVAVDKLWEDFIKQGGKHLDDN